MNWPFSTVANPFSGHFPGSLGLQTAKSFAAPQMSPSERSQTCGKPGFLRLDSIGEDNYRDMYPSVPVVSVSCHVQPLPASPTYISCKKVALPSPTIMACAATEPAFYRFSSSSCQFGPIIGLQSLLDQFKPCNTNVTTSSNIHENNKTAGKTQMHDKVPDNLCVKKDLTQKVVESSKVEKSREDTRREDSAMKQHFMKNCKEKEVVPCQNFFKDCEPDMYSAFTNSKPAYMSSRLIASGGFASCDKSKPGTPNSGADSCTNMSAQTGDLTVPNNVHNSHICDTKELFASVNPFSTKSAPSRSQNNSFYTPETMPTKKKKVPTATLR